MAGVALALDLLTAKGTSRGTLHSFSSLNAVSAAVSAAVGITFLPLYPAYSPQFEPWDFTRRIAFCEESEDPLEPWAESDPRWLPHLELKHKEGLPKAYNVELKPLFSAFRPRALGATTVRACLVNFLPLLEAYMQPEEDDVDEDVERPANLPTDPLVPLKRSATHILREVSVITMRRVLERATIHYASPRMAWKLLKDVPKSAVRKAGRDTSNFHIFLCVARTNFRGHALGVIANWVVQLVLDIFRYLHFTLPKKKGEGKKHESEGKKKASENREKDFNRLMRKTAGNTLKGGASLLCASVGAGLGTILIKPSIGTWIGCAAGDLAGPYLIGIWFDAWILYGTFSAPDYDP